MSSNRYGILVSADKRGRSVLPLQVSHRNHPQVRILLQRHIKITVFVTLERMAVHISFPVSGIKPLFPHSRLKGKQSCHLIGSTSRSGGQGARQQRNASTFCKDLAPILAELAQLLKLTFPAVKLTGEQFGKASGQINQVRFRDIVSINRAEEAYAAHLFKIAQILLVDKMKSRVRGNSYAPFPFERLRPRLHFRSVRQAIGTGKYACRQIQKLVKIKCIPHQVRSLLYLPVEFRLHSRSQGRIFGRHPQRLVIRKIPQTFHPRISAHFAQEAVLSRRKHMVEDYARYTDILSETLEAEQHRGQRISR